MHSLIEKETYMSIFYQFSGPSNESLGFDTLTAKYLKHDCFNMKKMVVIASNPNDYATTDDYFTRHKHWFQTICPTLESVHVLDHRISKDVALALLNDADMVHLMGGDVLSEYHFIHDYEFVDALKSGDKVIMGTSAGAMVLGDTIILVHEHHSSTHKGLNLVSSNIIPHYTDEQLQKVTPFAPCYALPDDSGIRITANTTTFLNEVLFISKNE